MCDKKSKILVLGYGLLGKEIVRQTGWDYISREKDSFDFTEIDSFKDLIKNYNVIINCIACCDTYGDNKNEHWDVNYKGVANLVDHLQNTNQKLVQIGTDQLYSNSVSNVAESDVPVHTSTWYSYTKLLADGYVQLKMNNYLIVRGSHKEKPFMYDKGMISQIGNFDYVDVMAEIIISLVKGGAKKIYNIGTETKSAYELGLKTKKDLIGFEGRFFDNQPLDLTMDLKKLNKFMKAKKNN